MKMQNAYTDAPKLHENLILGSLHLFFWLFFHPAAWGNHLARIDPTLSPHFTLAELSLAQWRQPALQRLLVMILVVWPFLLALSLGLGLWALGSTERALINIAVAVTCSLFMSVVMGTMLALQTAAIGGVLFSFGVATVFSELSELRGMQRGYFISSFTEGSELQFILLGAGISLASGLFGSFVSRLAPPERKREQGQRVQALLLGLSCAVVAFVAAFYLLWGAKAGVNVFNVTVIVAFGTLFGLITGWRLGDWPHSMKLVMGIISLFGAAFLLAISRSGPLATGIAFGLFVGALTCLLFILPYIFVERIAGPRTAAVIAALGSGSAGAALYVEFIENWPIVLPISLVATLSGLTLSWWGPVVLYPFQVAWNRVLYRADQARWSRSNALDHTGGWQTTEVVTTGYSSLRWHSAFWDEYQWLPLFGLQKHLLLVTERNRAEGLAAIEYLSTSRQRWAAQAAQIELDARRLEQCADVEAISQASGELAAGELEGPASALLRTFSRISQDVLAARQQTSRHRTRLALRAVEERLDELLRELTRSREPYAVRFCPIAANWRQMVADGAENMAQAAEQKQEIDNPYVFSVPLSVREKIFVGRTDIIARIEQQLLQPRRPPLLLYGQRRMGKTSLLENLSHLLPRTIVPLFVDGQRVSDANDSADFIYNIAKEMIKSAQRQRGVMLPSLPRESLTSHPFDKLRASPFTSFNEWLDDVEQAISTTEPQVALLMLDEFEELLRLFQKEEFDERELLRMLRHLIQHRPRFKLLLASSHALSEFERWSSTLINVQIIKISYLSEKETRQLIEQPIKNFPLHYEPDATEHIYRLTRGYPHLVQLLCYEMVELKNAEASSKRRLACRADVEAAIGLALASGSFFFTDIEQNQVDQNGIALLRYLAAQGEGAIVKRDGLSAHLAHDLDDTLDDTLDLLLQRDLIELVHGGYRFQVELIRRWFDKK